MPSLDTQNGPQIHRNNNQNTPLDLGHSSCLSVVAELRLDNGRTLVKRGDTKETLWGDFNENNITSTGTSNILHMENGGNLERWTSTAAETPKVTQQETIIIKDTHTPSIAISPPSPAYNIDLGTCAYQENGGNARSPTTSIAPTKRTLIDIETQEYSISSTRTTSDSTQNDMTNQNVITQQTLRPQNL